jgi:ABC-type transport system involved in multi-copper enzyme maturation permease subunit
MRQSFYDLIGWPLLAKEFRTYIRGARSGALVAIYVGLLLLALILLYRSVVGQVALGAPLVSAQIGQALFIGLSLALQVLTVFLAPAMTVHTMSSEHERGTFDILMMTPASAVHILLSKLLVALAFLLVLLLSALPLFSVIVLFGGVNLAHLGPVVLTVLLSALVGSMLGMFCSVITRQTYLATVLCYAILVSVIGGSLFAANLWSAIHPQLSVPPGYVLANPLSALASALINTQPPDIVNTGSLQPLIILGLLTQGTIVREGAQFVVLPLYRTTWVLYGATSLVLFWACVRVIHIAQARRFWAVSRSDMVLALLCTGYAVTLWLSRAWWLPAQGGS